MWWILLLNISPFARAWFQEFTNNQVFLQGNTMSPKQISKNQNLPLKTENNERIWKKKKQWKEIILATFRKMFGLFLIDDGAKRENFLQMAYFENFLL